MTLARRQALLARFLTEAEFEHRVRSDPETVAEEFGVDRGYVDWVAGLEPGRVAAFRASRQVKARRREG